MSARAKSDRPLPINDSPHAQRPAALPGKPPQQERDQNRANGQLRRSRELRRRNLDLLRDVQFSHGPFSSMNNAAFAAWGYGEVAMDQGPLATRAG